MQMDEIQSRVRNKASKMLGKWVVRSAVHSSRKQADIRVCLDVWQSLFRVAPHDVCRY